MNMENTRREFLKKSALAGTLTSVSLTTLGSEASLLQKQTRLFSDEMDEKLKAILQQPVLKQQLFPDPVIIESLDLIKVDRTYLVRARARDGAEGYAVSNWGISNFWPIFVNHVGPFFVGKDARKLDTLLHDCFIDRNHYKMQSMAIWTPLASAELAILDLLGQVSGKPVYDLLGELHRPNVKVYWANNYRDRGFSAEDSVRMIKEEYLRQNPPAVKVKIGGRMGLPEVPQGRTEKMIPLLRKELGEEVVIYADANGGYDVKEAIRIGRILEAHDVAFFEEPCPFYDLWETKEVADALDIPIAAGEQESSMRRFRWMAAHDGAQVLQPDLFYFGGMIRSIKVARMAQAAGMPCTPHVSGGDMNMLFIAHFAAMIPNAGEHQEYKAPGKDIPYEIIGGNIEAQSGNLTVPTGPGLGFRLDPDWVKNGRLVSKANM